MKRKMFSGAIILICLAVVGLGTLAYFTAEDTATNVITAGNIKIELLEWADEAKTEPFPRNGVDGVMPGAQITKIIEVKNVGDNPAYIRVSVDKTITLENGEEGIAGPITLDFDTVNWEEGTDGYYYYNGALAPGATTEPLFSSVTFDENMGNEYQNSTANINVTAYATQVANNGTDAMSAQW